jgi:tetratricopeptide (TPR) repeat protein
MAVLFLRSRSAESLQDPKLSFNLLYHNDGIYFARNVLWGGVASFLNRIAAVEKLATEKLSKIIARQRNLNRDALARRLGVDFTTLRKWLDGSNPYIPRYKAKLLAEYLGIAVDKILVPLQEEAFPLVDHQLYSESLDLIFKKGLFDDLSCKGEYALLEAIAKIHLSSDANRMGAAELMRWIGVAKLKTGAFEKALSYAHKAIAFAAAGSGGDLITARSKLLITSALLMQLQHDNAIGYFSEACSSFGDITAKIFWAEFYIVEGSLHQTIGQLDSAVSKFTRALRLLRLEPQGIFKGQLEARAHVGLCESFLHAGQLNRAQESLAALRGVSQSLQFREGLFFVDYFETWLLAVSGKKPLDSLERFSNLYYSHNDVIAHPLALYYLGVIVFLKNGLTTQAQQWIQEITRHMRRTMGVTEQQQWIITKELKKVGAF